MGNELERQVPGLVGRYGLTAGAGMRFQELLALVAADPHVPTTLRDPAESVNGHLADSLVALEQDAVRSARKLADLGSGAGFPGLPLAIALPAAEVALVESNRRKCEFLERAVRECGLNNVDIVNARAEAWQDGMASRDVVSARALAPLGVVAEYAAPLLRIGGTLVAWRGRHDAEDETAAQRAAAKLGMEPPEAIAVKPYPGALNRHLYLLLKSAPTPPRFPRRPGVARKRPLGDPRST